MLELNLEDYQPTREGILGTGTQCYILDSILAVSRTINNSLGWLEDPKLGQRSMQGFVWILLEDFGEPWKSFKQRNDTLSF